MKIIDGHELERRVVDAGKQSGNNMLYMLAGFVIGFVDKAPEIVVRCKDCKHFEKAGNDTFVYCHCNNIHNEVPDGNWFCADGERKE